MRSETTPENSLPNCAMASATPSIQPMVAIEAPSTVARNSGNAACTSSELASMNSDTKPSAHTAAGKRVRTGSARFIWAGVSCS